MANMEYDDVNPGAAVEELVVTELANKEEAIVGMLLTGNGRTLALIVIFVFQIFATLLKCPEMTKHNSFMRRRL